jgi:transcription elongation factor Elf1
MKERIIHCDNCNKDTRQLIGKKESVQNGAKREFRHCTNCNLRTIKNKKEGKTYIKDYSNK